MQLKLYKHMKKSFTKFKNEFFQIARDEYCMEAVEFDEDYIKTAHEDGETPREAMDYYAGKYGLTNLNEY